MSEMLEEDAVQLIELWGVYDGWSVKVLEDGTQVNRWAQADGSPIPGYEHRFHITQKWIERQQKATSQV